ncbi:carboxypeptidase-like regulatory domain-containing protein [Maribacter litopenaei]|uniref:Carboxypeptidase-like regulatory domain-containing protein n=1 Tax=Maribacter litopenaei TaxID=2976127 RepID=A0ABY5YAQ3_9FLAO|nr:carboxypeptidase-like regulatory domain-containing protein [Maribacter litopenaei]UWX55794.1 carboxypeptidase-like regulatory domain-containing protein [Maribacter litopenaei]
MRSFFVFLMLLFVGTSIYGQNGDYIFGQLVDGDNNEPVAFASIRIKDAAMGVISNVDGTFRIPIRYKSIGDVLEISCMGYSTKLIDIQELKETEANIILIKPSAMELSEATVRAKLKKLDAREMVRIAVARIPQNYSLSPYAMVGYYRDYQIKNGNYNNLNEAVLNVYDSGFSNKDNFSNEYELYSYSPNLEFPVDSFALQPYDYRGFNKVIPHAKMENTGGNELVTLMIHDAIRNNQIEVYSFVDNMAKDFVEGHRFRLLGTTNFKDRSVYQIDCSFRDKDYYVDGTIFLDTGSFAILKLDYTVFRRKKPGELDSAINARRTLFQWF